MMAIASTAGRGVVAPAGPAQPGPAARAASDSARRSAAPGRRVVGLLAPPGRGHHGVRDGVLPDLVAAQLGDDVAGGEDRDPVAEAFQLPDVGGHDDHRGAGVGHLAQDAVDLGPRADVDALGRLLGQQQAGPACSAGPWPAAPSAGCRRTGSARWPRWTAP